MARLELALAGLFLAAWTLSLGQLAGLLRLDGALPLSLYALYTSAAAAGWLFGNVYVLRNRRTEGEFRWRLRLVYVLGPPGLSLLLHAMAPLAQQDAAPLVPLYAVGVYLIFFLVPVVLRPPVARRPGR